MERWFSTQLEKIEGSVVKVSDLKKSFVAFSGNPYIGDDAVFLKDFEDVFMRKGFSFTIRKVRRHNKRETVLIGLEIRQIQSEDNNSNTNSRENFTGTIEEGKTDDSQVGKAEISDVDDASDNQVCFREDQTKTIQKLVEYENSDVDGDASDSLIWSEDQTNIIKRIVEYEDSEDESFVKIIKRDNADIVKKRIVEYEDSGDELEVGMVVDSDGDVISSWENLSKKVLSCSEGNSEFEDCMDAFEVNGNFDNYEGADDIVVRSDDDSNFNCRENQTEIVEGSIAGETEENENFETLTVRREPLKLQERNFIEYFRRGKSRTEETNLVFSDKKFSFRKPEKEPEEFDNLVFSRHFRNFRQATPANLPCDYDTFHDFLESVYPERAHISTEMLQLISLAKSAQNHLTGILKSVLGGSFKPICVGNVAPKSIHFISQGDFFPQFTVGSCERLKFSCEVCKVYRRYLMMSGKALSIGNGIFEGFRQVYEHAITSHHQNGINWLKKTNSFRLAPSHLKRPSSSNLSEYFNSTEGKIKKVPCHHLWDPEIVGEFKNDLQLRRKQPKSIFTENSLWTNCKSIDGHETCGNYSSWKKKHTVEFKEICQESSRSFTSVFVPGKAELIINKKSVTIEGGIKNLEPVCTNSAINAGKHPFTCDNCARQRVYFNDLSRKRKNAALLQNKARVGRQGFRLSYATKGEFQDRVEQISEENKELKKQVKRSERAQYNKKEWISILFKSCVDDDVSKLVVDLVSFFQQTGKTGGIHFHVLKNLVGKLKSGINHKYTNLIKDIACVCKNNLGATNYSFIKHLFGLPGKTCADSHAEKTKLKFGFNDDVFETGVSLFKDGPVFDATDEARVLRFITPMLNEEHQIELVGHCWRSDCDEWDNSKVLLSDLFSESFPDQFTAVKSYIDGLILRNELAKSVAIHNFGAASGLMSKPLVHAVWPTPNSGYKGYHMLKIWDVVRSKCFLDRNNSLKENPINLIGHASDSAGFQLAAAVALMSTHVDTLHAGVKYLGLGIGESKFAAPYFGPLPSIAYLDYDHELRLLLKCLKYNTLELNLFPCKGSRYVATINHLKELKEVCETSGYQCSFSNNDLLFARFLDQNCDAALKIFTPSVATLLEENVVGSSATVLYINAVSSLFQPFLSPCSDPSFMQENISKGITVFRIWKEILKLKKKRIHSAPGASSDQTKRGSFLTYGCAQTAEILFAAATCHMLAVFAHFKHLGPSVLSPFKCGTKTTERLISEIQGKTNHLQSLDAQPVLFDALSRLSKVQTNHLAEDRLLAAGAEKQSTTNRRRLSHKMKEVEQSQYCYPETYSEFLEDQRNAFKRGTQQGIDMYKRFCPEGITFLEAAKGLQFLFGSKGLPKVNLFDGLVSDEYARRMLLDLKPADLLSARVLKKERTIEDFLDGREESKNVDENVTEVRVDKVSDNTGEGYSVEIDENFDTVEGAYSYRKDSEDTDGKNVPPVSKSSEWYLTKMENEKVGKIHITQALKFLIPREYVSRERSKRHIASNYLPGRSPIDTTHDIILFRFVIAKVSNKVFVCKVVSLQLNDKSVASASSKNENVKCRLIPLEEVSPFVYKYSSKVLISQWVKVSNIFSEIGLESVENGCFKVLSQFRDDLCEIRKKMSERKDHALAIQIAKSTLPLEFQEVDDIIERKVDFQTQEYLYMVKFKNCASDPVWLSASCFDRPFKYSKRGGLSEKVIYADRSGKVDEVKTDEPNQVIFKKGKEKRLTSKHQESSVQKIRRFAFTSSKAVKYESNSVDTSGSSVDLTKETVIASVDLTNEIDGGSVVDFTGESDDLTSSDLIKLLSGSQMLKDQHMLKAVELLKKEFPGIKGLQDSVYAQSRFKPVSGDSLQFHHVEGQEFTNHWLLSTACEGKVYVYDSSYRAPPTRVQKQLGECYHSLVIGECLEVTYPSVFRQEGSTDCGLFAIAYAVEIAHGRKPNDVYFDQFKMREHFSTCIQNNCISPFPRLKSKRGKKKLAAIHSIKVR